MRGRVIVTHLSPPQLFEAMTHQARAATIAIQRLASEPLAPGETCVDRALETSRHALALADAFEILDALAAMSVCPVGEDAATAESSSGVMCPGTEDATTN